VYQAIDEDKIQQNALEVGKYLKDGLLRLQAKYPLIGDVRGKGLMLGTCVSDGHVSEGHVACLYL
jgi:4-aminobutyrate aminotransferase-like enzyme